MRRKRKGIKKRRKENVTDTILIIDDNQGILNLIQMLLESKGYKTRTALDGEEGIRLFDKGLFSLVITDIQMPKKDGHAVARHIRHSSMPDIPIIAISAGHVPKNDDFDLMIRKPFEIEKFTRAVRELLSCEKRGRAVQ
jgi:two-component system sensor histidine kinase ChiS